MGGCSGVGIAVLVCGGRVIESLCCGCGVCQGVVMG